MPNISTYSTLLYAARLNEALSMPKHKYLVVEIIMQDMLSRI